MGKKQIFFRSQSGIHLQNYGTVVVTLADEDKAEALPLVRRFYNLGFNIITMLTSLDTVKVLLDVPEETTIGISTINS